MSICPGDDSELRAGTVKMRLILCTPGFLRYRVSYPGKQEAWLEGLTTSTLGCLLLLVTLSPPPWGGRKDGEREAIPTGKGEPEPIRGGLGLHPAKSSEELRGTNWG